jgi:hypothetical protein
MKNLKGAITKYDTFMVAYIAQRVTRAARLRCPSDARCAARFTKLVGRTWRDAYVAAGSGTLCACQKKFVGSATFFMDESLGKLAPQYAVG